MKGGGNYTPISLAFGFLMNLMLVSGGYPWTVIRVQERSKYFEFLEQASVEQSIDGFARFLARKLREKND